MFKLKTTTPLYFIGYENMNTIYTSLKPEKNGPSNHKSMHTKTRLISCKSSVSFFHLKILLNYQEHLVVP